MSSVSVRAQRFGKVQTEERLETGYAGNELELRLVDAPSEADIAVRPVPVPERVSRLHPVARQFRDRTELHEVARAAFARCARIVHALAIEAERRGYTINDAGASDTRHRRRQGDEPSRQPRTRTAARPRWQPPNWQVGTGRSLPPGGSHASTTDDLSESAAAVKETATGVVSRAPVEVPAVLSLLATTVP